MPLMRKYSERFSSVVVPVWMQTDAPRHDGETGYPGLKLRGDELCASSSNRNFIGRQGSASGRTVLMSPVMVAAAAVTGMISDARSVFSQGRA
jgi:hypothetical protein